MNKDQLNSLALVVLLTVAVILGSILVSQNADIRKGAYFAKTAVVLKPTEFDVAVGDNLPVEVWVVTEGDAKVDGVEPYICFGSHLGLATDNVKDSITPNQDKNFNIVTLARFDSNNNCVKFQVGSMGTDTQDLPTGAFKAATLRLKANSQGSGTINIDQDKTKISGRNSDLASTDTALQVTGVEGSSYTVGSGTGGGGNEPTNPPASADDMWINYKVAFAGVRANRACSTNWQTKLTVLSGDTRREYNNVPLTQTTATNSAGEVIYEGSLQLAGFRQESGVAVFFKGPKHLQVKYGVNNQSASYNKAGGEITLTSSQSGSQVVNLSGYPMLAGDIDGNGVIDGVDFGKVKVKSARFDQVADGGYMAEDLDGSCQVNNNDTILLVRSLNEKQDQVY